MNFKLSNQTSTNYLLFWSWKISIFALVFILIWCFFDQEALPPNGNGFHLLMLFIGAHVGGKIVSVIGIPQLLGYLVAGIIYGNLFNVTLNRTLTTTIRSIALMIIFLRAGLNLDPTAIKRLVSAVFQLGFLPALLETIIYAILSIWLLKMNIAWALMLGFVVAAVSPAVVVPEMIKLKENNIGVSKGIPTLAIAAASMDNILTITGFYITFSFAFDKNITNNSTGNMVWSIAKGPVEILIGIIYGLVFGSVLWFIPDPSDGDSFKSKRKYNIHRFTAILLFGSVALFGSAKCNFKSSGPLAILVLSFMVAIKWRPRNVLSFQQNSLKTLWIIFEHFLYVLIGFDARFNSDTEIKIIFYSILILIIGVTIRMVTAFIFTYGIDYNIKERLFIALAWLPKATVQAAIGSIALENATTDDETRMGSIILNIAVLSILITAPLGAIAIDVTSRKFLVQDEQEEQRNNQIIEADPNQAMVRQSITQCP